jgi:hypothetical protein
MFGSSYKLEKTNQLDPQRNPQKIAEKIAEFPELEKIADILRALDTESHNRKEIIKEINELNKDQKIQRIFIDFLKNKGLQVLESPKIKDSGILTGVLREAIRKEFTSKGKENYLKNAEYLDLIFKKEKK